MSDLPPELPTPPPPEPPRTNRDFGAGVPLPYPAFPPKDRDELPPTGPGSPGIIGPRFGARIIDTLPFAILFSLIARQYVRIEDDERIGSIPVWLVIVAFLLPLAYEAGMVAWRGQTVGKMVLKLEVIRYDDGGHVLPYQAVMRAVIFNIASLAGLGLPNVVGVPLQVIGLIIALSVLFDRLYRGLQDKAAGTIVLRTR